MSDCEIPRGLGMTGSVRRVLGMGVLATGAVCPCHVLVALVALLTGSAVLAPAAQDGLHAVYVPAAVLAGAGLLGFRRPSGPRSTSLRGDG
jgi:hypothetical protein